MNNSSSLEKKINDATIRPDICFPCLWIMRNTIWINKKTKTKKNLNLKNNFYGFISYRKEEREGGRFPHRETERERYTYISVFRSLAKVSRDSSEVELRESLKLLKLPQRYVRI